MAPKTGSLRFYVYLVLVKSLTTPAAGRYTLVSLRPRALRPLEVGRSPQVQMESPLCQCAWIGLLDGLTYDHYGDKMMQEQSKLLTGIHFFGGKGGTSCICLVPIP